MPALGGYMGTFQPGWDNLPWLYMVPYLRYVTIFIWRPPHNVHLYGLSNARVIVTQCIGGHFSLDGTIYHRPRCSTDNLNTRTLEYIAPVHVLQLHINNSSVIV